MDDDDDDYDHLIPNIDFGHLCDCTYGRVSLVMEEDEEGESMEDEVGNRRAGGRDEHMANFNL